MSAVSLLDDVRAAFCCCDSSEGNHFEERCIDELGPRFVSAMEAAEGMAYVLEGHIEALSGWAEAPAQQMRDAVSKYRASVAAPRGEP